MKINQTEAFSSAFEHASIGMALVAPNGAWLKVNNSLCQLLEYNAAELMDKTFQDITHPEDLEKDLAYVKQMLSAEIESYQMEKRYFTKTGNMVWVLLSVSLVWEDKKPLFFISQIQDITQNKRQEDLLARQNERLQQIIHGTDIGTWEWNVQTGETIFNERWANIIGYELKELEPTSIDTWVKYAHPEDLQKSDSLLQDCFTGKAQQYEVVCRMKHRNGHWVWVLDRGKVLTWTKDGKPEWMYGSHSEITEIKEFEKALLESRQKFKNIFNSTFQHTFLLSIDGSIKEVNQTALAFAQINEEEAFGTKIWDSDWFFLNESSKTAIKSSFQTALEGKAVNGEIEIRNQLGISTPVLFNLKPLTSFEDITGFVLEFRPIREIVEARKELIAKNKELESFASRAAHDLKEPLRSISQLLLMFSKKYESLIDESAQQYIDFILDASDRMSDFIDKLLQFTQASSLEDTFEEINLNSVVEEVIKDFQWRMKEVNANVKVDELPSIYGSRVGMKIVFQNLISNALNYRDLNRAPQVEINAKRQKNSWLISITDNGVGIDSAKLHLIFQAFRRLHDDSTAKGYGLGLSTVEKVLQHHDGRIWVESERGTGSTFFIEIQNKKF